MHRLVLTKPDGRLLRLYAREPLDPGLTAPSPDELPPQANPHMRWHPLRGEWIAYAVQQQDRAFPSPPGYDPLAPAQGEVPTEVPAGNWEVAVFDNRFPSLALQAHDPPALGVPTAPANGHCEVVVYAQGRELPLGRLQLPHIELLMQVWGERTRELGQLPQVQYVMPFENRGAELGATLHHPHAQLYAYPVVPPVPQRMLHLAEEYRVERARGPLLDLIHRELADRVRLLYEGPQAVAFVPVCARHPYEAWVAPIEPVESFAELGDAQRADLARALKTVLLKYDGLWQRPMPYLMAWYQAPTDGRPHPEAHLHAQLCPPYRAPDRLRALGGSELAAGFFTMDALPEDKARELQAVKVDLGG